MSITHARSFGSHDDNGDCVDAGERIKEAVFGHIRKSQKLRGLAAAGDFDGVVKNIISSCGEDARQSGGVSDARTLCTLATAILHYGLTAALIKSQRKFTHRGVEIDIAIPDARTLDADPRRALVICVMATCDEDAISTRVEELAVVQPVRENIWMVVPDAGARPGRVQKGTAAPGGARRLPISYAGGSFAGIFSDIARFQNAPGQQQGPGSRNLRILGI